MIATIGATELISIGRNYVDVPAKVDTGADCSAIWASKIRVSQEGILSFTLFDEKSPYYTGKIFKRTDFGVAKVKSSNGTKQIRYSAKLTVMLSGRKIRVRFYLSNRSTQKFPVLIGRRTIHGKFIVDVTRRAVGTKPPSATATNHLRKELLRKGAYSFHEKYKERLIK